MKWINVKEQPITESGRFLVGLWVYSSVTENDRFDYHDLVFDGHDVYTVDEDGVQCDCFTGWNKEDFQFWMKVGVPENEKRN